MLRLSALAFRVACVVVALGGGLVLTPTVFAQDDKLSMRDKLSTLIDTKDFDRPMTLTDAVKRIHDQCAAKGVQLIIRVDHHGLARLIPGPTEEGDEPKVRLPSDPRAIAVGEALRLLISQIRPNGAAMLVRNGAVEVVAPEDARLPALLRRNVRWRFDKVTLAEGMARLSDMTGANIVLDPRLGEKVQTPINPDFRNDLPLEAALQVFAEMGDVRFVRMDGVIYVTTPSNAEAVEQRQAHLEKKQLEMVTALGRTVRSRSR